MAYLWLFKISGEFNVDVVVNNKDNSGTCNATKYALNYDLESDLANCATDSEFWELENVVEALIIFGKILKFKILNPKLMSFKSDLKNRKRC